MGQKTQIFHTYGTRIPRSMLWRCNVTDGIEIHTFEDRKEGNVLANVVGVDSELRPPRRVEDHQRWRLPVNLRR